MLKLFLVEDETIIRESIKRNIRWEDHGYVFVGEAGDGEMAYPLISETKPDVVITDIKMPFMNGLELGQLLHREMPWIKIILLTGYGEFDYAKKAIQIGAAEYLLKPVTSAVIVEAIERVGGVILEERRQQAFVQQYQREMQELEKLEQMRFFEELASGGKSAPELLSRASGLGLSLSAAAYNIILVNLYQQDLPGESYSDDLVRTQALLEQFLAGHDSCIPFKRGIEGYALLVKGSSEDATRDSCREIAQGILQLLQGEGETGFFIGVGAPISRLGDIPGSFQSASQALAHRYLGDSGQLLFFEEMRRLDGASGELRLETLDTRKIKGGIIGRFLRSGTGGNARYLVDELLDSIGEEQLQSALLRQYIVMDIYITCAGFVEEIGASKAELARQCGDFPQLSEALGTLESSRAFLRDILEYSCSLRDGGSQKKYDGQIGRAKQYIHDNYTKADISLNTVAKAVNLSPNHFSAVFSRETGHTFVEYLTAARMDKAKEMLRCTGKKSSEIAYEVGYRDPHYFSFLFKKLHGVTPREFRARGEAEI